MDKFLILIWLWFLGSGDEANQVQVNSTQAMSNDIEEAIYILPTVEDYVLSDLFTEIDSTKACNECHSDMLEGENVHSPAKKDCQRCHIANGAEHPLEAVVGFNLKTDVPNLCYECHDPKTESDFVHDPIKKGECLICHDIHNSPNMFLVKKDPVSGLCLDCHELNIPEGNMVHGAVTEGNCVGCHNPHEADNKVLLKTTKLDRLCRSCHRPLRKEFKMEVIHDPFMKKDCFSCHNGHSSKEAHLSDLKPQDLCLSCHEDTHNEISSSAVVHEAVNEKEACINCHSPHASAEKGILKGKEIDVCLSCHDKVIPTITKNIEAISPLLKEGNSIHGPIAEGQCSVCHKPHASEEHTLLTKKYPSVQYSVADVDNFSLCFECHDNQLFASPTTESATNFRNGNQNLHYLHVQGNRGRNCNLCHDVHGAENKYLIKNRAQFGNWKMPIEFELTNVGGSCLTGCHTKYSYERIVLPDSVDIKD